MKAMIIGREIQHLAGPNRGEVRLDLVLAAHHGQKDLHMMEVGGLVEVSVVADINARTCGDCRHYYKAAGTDKVGYCNAPVSMALAGKTFPVTTTPQKQDANECPFWRQRQPFHTARRGER